MRTINPGALLSASPDTPEGIENIRKAMRALNLGPDDVVIKRECGIVTARTKREIIFN